MPDTRRLAVIGGGLAGISAALTAADAGANVTLLERRRRLGGRTWSFTRNGLVMDNGQHVVMRCCTEYLRFVERIGAASLVTMQPRLDVAVLAPARRAARIARSTLPSPLHLAGSLLRYPHLTIREKVAAARAMRAMQRVGPDDRDADARSFGDWLIEHGQSERAISVLWDLIARPTLNVDARQASLALAAKVFRTGFLDSVSGGDLGWPTAPLATLHDELATAALRASGVEIVTGVTVNAVTADGNGFEVCASDRHWTADAVIVALPPAATRAVLPAAAHAGLPPRELSSSPIVNVHLVYDRRVTDLPFAAAVDSPVQFVFDRTTSSGMRAPGQYLVVSLSAADAHIATRATELVRTMSEALADLLPAAAGAVLTDAMVTRERDATFLATPGSRSARPAARTAIDGLTIAGAWTDTGWPDTMEGAVRSGQTAAHQALHHRRTARPAVTAP